MSYQHLSNMQKVATFLISLGAERSAEVLEYLEPQEVTRITQEIALIGQVTQQTKRAVLREFRLLVNKEEQQHSGINFAKELLDRTLGTEQAQVVLTKMTPALGEPAGPPYLTTVTIDRAAELLSNEPPKIIALYLSYLEAALAARILQTIPEQCQAETALQLGNTPPPAFEMRTQLERAIRAKAMKHAREESLRGEAVLQSISQEHEEMLTDTGRDGISAYQEALSVAPASPPPAEPPLTFDDLRSWSFPQLQAFTGELDNAQLSIALKGADHELRELLLAALPFRRRVAVQRKISSRAPLRLGEITEAQEQIGRLAGRFIADEDAMPTVQHGDTVHV